MAGRFPFQTVVYHTQKRLGSERLDPSPKLVTIHSEKSIKLAWKHKILTLSQHGTTLWGHIYPRASCRIRQRLKGSQMLGLSSSLCTNLLPSLSHFLTGSSPEHSLKTKQNTLVRIPISDSVFLGNLI